MEKAALLRPWMLGMRSDFSVSGGFVEPDVACILMELIMTEGLLVCIAFCVCRRIRFCSNPDQVGTEKLHLTRPPKEYLDGPYSENPQAIGCPLSSTSNPISALRWPSTAILMRLREGLQARFDAAVLPSGHS